MPLPPTSARGPALNYVELRPTLVFETPGKVSHPDKDKTEKLYQKRPHKDDIEKRFEGHSECVRRGLIEKRHKEQEAARDAANQKLEGGFSLNWSTTSKARPKSKAEPKQLPLFAAKLHNELLENEADEFEGQPLASILGCEAKQDGAAVPHNFTVGDEVEVRDKDMLEWRAGVVTSETPLKVTLDDWDHAFQWDFVRRLSKPKEPPNPPQSLPPMPPVVQPETHCVCGYKFLQDAVFCSRCGRQRGCELPKSQQQPRPASKPPRPPGEPIARKPKRPSLPEQPTAHLASSGRLGSPSPRRHSAEMTQRPSLGSVSKGSRHAWEGTRLGSSRADSLHETFHVEVYEEFQKSASPLLPAEPAASSQQSASQKSKVSKWQQLTVPILTDNGEVVALKPAAPSQQSAWQQHTVPILGEDGQVVALRPAMGSSPMPEWKQTALPIFNEQGELVALPSGRSAWQQNTVPILGQDGEVIALRPDAGKGAGWRQMAVPVFNITGEVVAVHPPIGNLKQWQQLTVPILAEDGKVLGLRPSGQQYEMPAWECPATAQGSRPTASAGSSIVSDRTWLPAPPDRQPFLFHSSPKSARSSRAVSEAAAEATLRPARSGRWTQESCSEAESVNSCGKPRSSAWPDASSAPALSKEEDVPRPSILQGSRCSTPDSRAGDAASCASFQHILRSASADSLASIDRILNMANAARQATPDGQMMQVLRDALCSETSGSSAAPSGHFQLPQAPEADELVARLRQLPELWRGTILQMLEQAEAVQQAAKDFPKV